MKEKPIKSFKYGDKNEMKVEDELFIGDLERTDFFKDKCSMCYFNLYPEKINENVLIMEDEMCTGHEIFCLIDQIGSKKSLRIERWRDESKHWRAGIEWYKEGECEFVCESPTLLECLKKIENYLDKIK